MQLTLAIEFHFTRDPSGAVYGSGPMNRAFWDRYLDVFDHVTVLARVREVDNPGDPAHRADGDGVSFIDLPDFTGPAALARAAPQVWSRIGLAVAEAEALLFRVPGTVGTIAAIHARLRRKPYAVEVVGDPWDALAPGTVRSLSRPLVRGPMALAQRRMAHRAIAAAYVTKGALQRRYPPGRKAYSTHYSSIELPEAQIVGAQPSRIARIAARSKGGDGPWRLGFIGSFNVMYKAPDVHLRAVAELRRRGLDVRLELLGDGAHQGEMKALADQLGLVEHTVFHGRLAGGAPVMAFLDRMDVFLIASRTEGLPRALIEAMARGCPAIGSQIGGIPELLESPWLVPADDVTALADAVERALVSPETMVAMAQRNGAEAAGYGASILRHRRRRFYTEVVERTI